MSNAIAAVLQEEMSEALFCGKNQTSYCIRPTVEE
jgi:hypothetical protein